MSVEAHNMEQSQSSSSANSVFQLMRERLIDIAKLEINVGVSCEMRNILSDRLLDLAEAEMEFSQSAVQEADANLKGLLQQITKALADASQMEFPAEIPDSALESLRELTPLVPEEKREEFAEIVAPAKAAERKVLTLENIKWLLGIILPILFTFYMHQLPDKNAEEQVQLHREEVAIEQRENELREEEIELFRELFDYVKESGISPLEEISPIQEQLDIVEENVDTFDNPALPNLEPNDRPHQPSDQHSQD